MSEEIAVSGICGRGKETFVDTESLYKGERWLSRSASSAYEISLQVFDGGIEEATYSYRHETHMCMARMVAEVTKSGTGNSCRYVHVAGNTSFQHAEACNHGLPYSLPASVFHGEINII